MLIAERLNNYMVILRNATAVKKICRPWDTPADVKRLRQLEQENGRVKKLVAERALEIEVMKEITRKNW